MSIPPLELEDAVPDELELLDDELELPDELELLDDELELDVSPAPPQPKSKTDRRTAQPALQIGIVCLEFDGFIIIVPLMIK